MAVKAACGNGFPLNIPSVIPESGGSGGSGETYSTDETEIGTWLGAPLYRKVVTHTVLKGSATISVDLGVSDVTVRRFEVYLIRANESSLRPLPFISVDNQYNISVMMNTHNTTPVMYIAAINSSIYAESTIIAIIEYTKNS